MIAPSTTATPEEADVLDAPELALSIDAKRAAKMGREEVGYLVESYYELQEARKRTANRVLALERQGEPKSLMSVYADHFTKLEGRTSALLRAWCRADAHSAWAMETVGVGPVIAAGLAAHIRVERASSPSAVWRFAGLDPTSEWVGKEGARDVVTEAMAAVDGDLERAIPLVARRVGMRVETVRKFATSDRDGEPIKLTKASLVNASARRPWNAALKVLCWKLGDSFVKVSGRPNSLYGRLYRERKEREVGRNESGAFAETAAETLASKNFSKGTVTRDAYEEGKLPAGRLDLRARRHAVKVFLVHYWTKGWMLAHPGQTPPAPYIIAHGGHVDLIAPEVPY